MHLAHQFITSPKPAAEESGLQWQPHFRFTYSYIIFSETSPTNVGFLVDETKSFGVVKWMFPKFPL